MSQAGYTPIQLYYSTTAAAAPSAGNLANGELAVNITDGKLFYKDNGGVVRVLATAAGAAGDVVGPGSSTDNALVRFDGTTGKLVQSSVGVLSDAGVLTGLTGLTSSGSITFSGLTSGRVTYAGTGGLLQDSANLTFDGTTLTANALTVSNAVTLSGGTANGVTYLNGSKVLTSGSALTFDGTRLGINIASPTLTLEVGGNAATGYMHSGVGVLSIGSKTNFPVGFDVNNSEQMRLTSTGLGIGTSSAVYKLVVSNGGASGIEFGPAFSGTANLIQSYNRSGGAYVNTVYDANEHIFNTLGTQRMRLDSSGNLGLGVTPSAWAAQYKAFQFGNLGGGSLAQDNTNGFTHFSQNTTFTGNNSAVYQTGGYATNYLQTGGQHIWRTAPSGTAGNAISFTQAMTLDASGNLLVGTSSGTNARLYVVADGGATTPFIINNTASGTSESTLAIWRRNGTNTGSISITGSLTLYNTTSDYRLKTVLGPVSDAGSRIDALEPVEYEWKVDGSRTRGFLAHQFQEVYAGSVTGSKDAVDEEGKPVYQAMQAGSAEVIADLVAELQSVRKRLAALEAA